MLVSARRYPLRYPAGTLITSKQSRNIVGSTFKIGVPVGYEYVIPEGMEKLVIVETIFGIRLDRFFLTDGKKLLPIYVKIYDHDSYSPVLLFKDGISNTLGTTGNCEFLKTHLLTCIEREMESIDAQLVDVLREYHNCPHEGFSINNDEAVYLPCPELKTSVPYPWNLMDNFAGDYGFWLEERSNLDTSRLAGHLNDLAIQISVADLGAAHPLYSELSYQLNPLFSRNYENVALDPITKLCLKEPEIDRNYLLRNMVMPLRSNVAAYMKQNPFGWKEDEVEVLTSFPSSLLEFCVVLHELPVIEFMATYILPTREIVESLKIHMITPYSRNVSLAEPLSHLKASLAEWNSEEFSEVTLAKTANDEVFIWAKGQKGEKKYFLDLTFTTLLSQCISHTK